MTDIPPRWYCVDRHGMTTLCADEDNARAEASENDVLWPRNAPHTAVQLAPVPASAVKIVGWVHEDELPQGYPYDAMFPHSRVDGVRMFPVFAPVPAQPTITPEQARDAQSWAGMDGATAWHLIDRHADGWGDVGVMMDAWLEANRFSVPAQPAEAEGVEALADAIYATANQFDAHRAGLPEDYVEWANDVARRLRDHVAAARRLRNSPQPVSSGPFGAFYVCPICSGAGAVTQAVHDAARSAGGDHEA